MRNSSEKLHLSTKTNHMARMKQDSDRMLKEEAEVREQYAQAFRLESQPTISEVSESQSHHYFEALTNQLSLRTQRLSGDCESEEADAERKKISKTLRKRLKGCRNTSKH